MLDNNISFIIRCKGNANYLTNKKCSKNDLVNEIKNKVKIHKFSDTIQKTVFLRAKNGNPTNKYVIEINNDCNIVTNLTTFNVDEILNAYKSRWDIETYFKYIKTNFKIQHTKEKSKKDINIKKIYL